MNNEYGTIRATRIRQIARYLALMDVRTHEQVRGDCFLIISDSRHIPEGDRRLCAKATLPVSVLLANGVCRGASNDGLLPLGPDCGYGGFYLPEDEQESRFVQWCFMRRRFAIDLPKSTINRHEGDMLVRAKAGFFYEASAPGNGISRMKDIRRWDPLMKYYLYGDEMQAAEEASWVLFQLWRLPIDTPLYVTSGAFKGGFDWEHDVPID